LIPIYYAQFCVASYKSVPFKTETSKSEKRIAYFSTVLIFLTTLIASITF